MLSRLDDSHERSTALVELRRDALLLLLLRPVAGHTIHHGYIGT
jgi:hypothetical protein